MSKSSLITVLALIASVSAKPYYYSYGNFPYQSRAAADFYNPAAVPALPAAYSAALPAAYSAYTTPYSAAYTSYPGPYAPLSGAFSAPLTLPAVSTYGSSYNVEELAGFYNPVAPVAPVAQVAPVAPVGPLAYASTYASPYSYVYKK